MSTRATAQKNGSRLVGALALLALLCLCLSSCGTSAASRIVVSNPSDFAAHYKTLMEPHSHTTKSDGKLTITQVINTYAGIGFGALAITDHNLVTWPWPVDPGEMVAEQGDEVSKYPSMQNFHMTSLCCDFVPDANVTPQSCIDQVLARKGLTVIAHPYYSGKGAKDIRKLTGYNGIEIYNRSAELIANRGYSLDVWDELLSTSGRMVWGYAVDDWHGNPQGLNWGKIVVLSNAVTAEALKASLESGSFYSVAGTGGLRFRDISVSGRQIAVETNEPADIRFIGRRGNVLGSAQNTPSAHYEVAGDELYVRIEAVSADGATTVYSNPVSVRTAL